MGGIAYELMIFERHTMGMLIGDGYCFKRGKPVM
jgi:hypothetical protein